MTHAPKPPCRDAIAWIKHHLGKNAFAPFTGQDHAAFATFVHALDLYARGDEDGRRGARQAMYGAVMAMQTKLRDVAKRAIPFALDWGDEDRVWHEIGFGDVPMWAVVINDGQTVIASYAFSQKASAERHAGELCVAFKGPVAHVVFLKAKEAPRVGDRVLATAPPKNETMGDVVPFRRPSS